MAYSLPDGRRACDNQELKNYIHMKIFKTVFVLFFTVNSIAQVDSTLFRRIPADSVPSKNMSMDAVYNRPFLGVRNTPVALGGYAEASYEYMGADGITEGHSFAFPRLTLFVSSSIQKKIKFLTEIEFEEGGKEVAIEFASLDFTFHPLFNFRGGVIMNPIGAFNQNHDGPKWEFVNRPIAMTQLLPATWSNPGFGFYGKIYQNKWAFGYEAYLTNGFDYSIISNSENKTFLPASKNNHERFEESSNGEPLLTAKVSTKYSKIIELGISYMGGVYNKFIDDGLMLDEKRRRVDVIALDINSTLPAINTFITAEWAWISVNIPETYTQQYGSKQQGGFLDIVQPFLKGKILGFEKSVLNASCRFEYVDWNVGTFNETGGNIGDELWAIVPGISFRPTAQTVIRFNYRFMQQKDILGNPPSNIGGVQFGIASYF